MEGNPDPNFKDDGPKVPDPAIPDRMVSTKRANQPFLAYKAYRDEQARLHAAWLERENARQAAIARGDPNPPPAEPDPTDAATVREIGLFGLCKFLVYVLLAVLLAGKFVTGEWFWGGEADVRKSLWKLWPAEQRLFSESLLAEFDGSDPHKPLYLAIDGDVYDVSSNRRIYGPGGSYALMAGVDAARAFGTGCFKEHRTYDQRGLSEGEIQSVEHWKRFFRDHKTYFKVGRVNHKPIDPMSPLPSHCDPKKDAEQSAQWARWGLGDPAAPHGKRSEAEAKEEAVESEPRDARYGGERTHEEL